MADPQGPPTPKVVKYEIDFLTKDGIRENLVDDEGLPWSSPTFSVANQEAGRLLKEDHVQEVRVLGTIIVHALKK